MKIDYIDFLADKSRNGWHAVTKRVKKLDSEQMLIGNGLSRLSEKFANNTMMTSW